MASIKSNSKFVAVTIKSNVVAINFDCDKVHTLECDLKKMLPNCNIQRSDYSSNLDETVFLPCSDISKCGQWFIFSFKKCLLLWKTSDWTLVGTAEMQRSPIKIKFSPDGSKIIIIDKGGDVFSYLRDNLSHGGSLLLGHLSLLFDVILTPDEKFIITCDRDEKIRVTCYPNTYSIKSYCLGHKKFVTALHLLPHCQTTLISVSGDETLRLWDFKSGKQIIKYNCLNDIDSKHVRAEEGVPFDESVAIINCQSFQSDRNESIVCLMFNNYKGCIFYIIKGSPNNMSCEKLQVINITVVPCDIYINDNLLWMVTSEDKFKVHAFQWNQLEKSFDSTLSSENVKNTLLILNKELDNFECNFKNKISVLYKRQFEEFPEHYKRKMNDVGFSEISKKNKKLPELS